MINVDHCYTKYMYLRDSYEGILIMLKIFPMVIVSMYVFVTMAYALELVVIGSGDGVEVLEAACERTEAAHGGAGGASHFGSTEEATSDVGHREVAGASPENLHVAGASTPTGLTNGDERALVVTAKHARDGAGLTCF